ncbi:MAG: histidine phosphatase family protein [Oscillospiraceae bacterium]|jgi:alpha-ribazole phosphatase|nr:histidine phosphatase family protein [Oscillospiraceae bacterium]
MKSYLIALLRHGTSEGEAEGRYIGHTDAQLTAEGRAQLRALREEYGYPAAQAVLISPLRRCRETAEILYPGQNTIALAGLQECYFGEFENKTAEELQNEPLFPRWLAGETGVTPPFGEEAGAFQARICTAFLSAVDGLIKTGTTRAAFITHGGVVMALLAAFGLPEAPMHEWLTPGGCGYLLRVTPSLWMRGRKCEVIAPLPQEPAEESPEAAALWKEREAAEFL